MRAVFGASVLFGLLAGCSGGTDLPPLAEVGGEVTFNGLPARAEVIFEPVDVETPGRKSRRKVGGRPSMGRTDRQGRFSLKFTNEQHGALVGRHVVTVNVFGSASQTDRAESYHDVVRPVRTARLKRTVGPGENHFHFAISY